MEVVEGGGFVSICGRQLNTIGNSTIDALVTHVAAGYGSVFANCHPLKKGVVGPARDPIPDIQ